MNNKQLVSIIIPTYKSDTTLKLAIDSVLKQTYSEIEIIVVDDNDPNSIFRENTEFIMKEYDNNNKVIYAKHEMNKNGSAARNTGFKLSRGKYICFLDDDDIFRDSKIENQVDYLNKHNQFQAVYSWRYQNGNVIKYSKTGDLSEEILSLSFTPYTSSIMLKRECYEQINGFDENYKRHQDFEFLLRFFEFYKIGVVEKPLVNIIGNQINNALHCNDLEQLKKQFLNQFSDHIERINNQQNGFKDLVYSKHYSALFWDYFRRRDILSASRIFTKYTETCGIIYWKCLISHLSTHLKIKWQNKRFSEGNVL